jgi:hypothetical protein
LAILRVYAPTDGTEESNDFYETLQKILYKVNKYYYIILIGDIKA